LFDVSSLFGMINVSHNPGFPHSAALHAGYTLRKVR
jgi:hypothetical protein